MSWNIGHVLPFFQMEGVAKYVATVLVNPGESISRGLPLGGQHGAASCVLLAAYVATVCT